jgi:hypothetical protein
MLHVYNKYVYCIVYFFLHSSCDNSGSTDTIIEPSAFSLGCNMETGDAEAPKAVPSTSPSSLIAFGTRKPTPKGTVGGAMRRHDAQLECAGTGTQREQKQRSSSLSRDITTGKGKHHSEDDNKRKRHNSKKHKRDRRDKSTRKNDMRKKPKHKHDRKADKRHSDKKHDKHNRCKGHSSKLDSAQAHSSGSNEPHQRMKSRSSHKRDNSDNTESHQSSKSRKRKRHHDDNSHSGKRHKSNTRQRSGKRHEHKSRSTTTRSCSSGGRSHHCDPDGNSNSSVLLGDPMGSSGDSASSHNDCRLPQPRPTPGRDVSFLRADNHCGRRELPGSPLSPVAGVDADRNDQLCASDGYHNMCNLHGMLPLC